MKRNFPPRIRTILRWLTPNGGTLLLVLALFLAQNVWARSGQDTLSVSASLASVNANRISYQGRLMDNQGQPLNGQVNLTFTLYDDPALTEAEHIKWGPETHLNVPVSNGLFSVPLGSLTEGGIPAGLWESATYDLYLQISVNDETLTPREPIHNQIIPKITTAQIADGAVTQAKAPTLIKSANGENEIILTGNTVIAGSNANGEIQIPYDCFPNGVGTFLALNGHWDANHSQVVGHNGAGQCSTTIIVSPPTSSPIRIIWIAIGN
jgi:hypothetical protein